jgi:hypothetical protein
MTMNDGFLQFEPETDASAADAAAWLDGSSAARVTPTRCLDLHCVADALPELGTVLWLHRPTRDRTFPRARLTPQGVMLLEHPALGVLADCIEVVPMSAVTSHGPREWLEFRNVHNAAIAKLYLLPDTDYLAWDAMLAGCRSNATLSASGGNWQAHKAFMHAAFACVGASWEARLVRMPMLRLTGLRVLGLRAPEPVSALGCRCARAIADDERAVWREA